MRPGDSADTFIIFGALLVAAGWVMGRQAVRQFRRPVETTEELRRRLDERGIPRYSQGFPGGDPRPWAPLIRWGAATNVVFAALIAAIGLLFVLNGLYQIVKWRL